MNLAYPAQYIPWLYQRFDELHQRRSQDAFMKRDYRTQLNAPMAKSPPYERARQVAVLDQHSALAGKVREAGVGRKAITAAMARK